MVTLKSKRFILRPLGKGDAQPITRHANNKKIYKNTAVIPYPYKLEDARGWIAGHLKKYKLKDTKDFVLTIEINGEACGAIGLHKIEAGHKAELGYWLGEEHWGKGMMPEAVKLMCDYSFKVLKLKRVYAYVYTFNEGSKRVLEKNSFKLEGILEKHAKKKNKYIDAYLFAKIKK